MMNLSLARTTFRHRPFVCHANDNWCEDGNVAALLGLIMFMYAVLGLNLFTFEYPYELVTGEWIMAIEEGGERLMEQRFEVVSELAAPAGLSVCYGQDFVS